MSRLTDDDLAAIRGRWDRECICPGTLFEDNPLKSMCGVCSIRRLLDEVAAIQATLDTSELQRKDDGERHSANYDAIVEACGAPDWEYPGQVVRDVRRLRKERDEARAALGRTRQTLLDARALLFGRGSLVELDPRMTVTLDEAAAVLGAS